MLIPPTKLRGDLLSLAELGTDAALLARRAGASFEAILAQEPMSEALLGDVYNLIGAAVPDLIAARCGAAIKLQYLGLLGYRLSNCATVGDVLVDWIEHSGRIGYPLAGEFEVRGDTWRMSFHARYPLSSAAENFCMVSTLAGFAQSVLNLSGHAIRLSRIALPSAALRGAIAPGELGADELLFNQAEPFVEGRRSDLDRRILAAEPQLLGLFEELFRQSWAHHDTLAGRLRDLFEKKGAFDLAGASDVLGMSVRSLQRHLAAEGEAFSDILDRYRHRRALHLLRLGKQSKWIAHELGFEDSSSFRRSFKRWTGNPLPTARRCRATTAQELSNSLVSPESIAGTSVVQTSTSSSPFVEISRF